MHEKSKTLSLKKPEVFFLSFAGVGFIPVAPGTFGTLATLPFLYALGEMGVPVFFVIPLLIIVTAISCYLAEALQQNYQLHDPSWIVMDEVLGMTVAWLFIGTHSLLSLMVLFALFRFFDIFKFGPTAYFDRMKHGAGTILDDIIAGLFAGLLFSLIRLAAPNLFP